MYKYDKMNIDKISKDMVKSLFYNDDGTRTDIYVDVLNDIKPYINPSSTIQIGGGIELEFESDLPDEDINPDELFTQIGGNILLQNYLVIRFRLWNYHKDLNNLNKRLRKTNVKVTDLFNMIEKLIKLDSGKAKGIFVVLKDYLMLKKSNVVFEYLNDDITANPIEAEVDKFRRDSLKPLLDLNKNKLQSYTRIAEYSYAKFIKKIENYFWKLFNINIFSITSIFKKLEKEIELQNKQSEKLLKMDERINYDKYKISKGDKLSEKIVKLIDKIDERKNDNAELLKNNSNILSDIRKYYNEVNKYFIPSTKKLNVSHFDNKLTIPLKEIFESLDSIIGVISKIKSNISNTIELLGDLYNDTVFVGKYENNIFNVKFGELRTEALKAKDAFDGIDSDLKEIKKRYLNSVYPNPDIKINMSEIRLLFDTIVNASLLPIISTFEPYFIKGQVIIDSSTIDAFIRNFGNQRVKVGGAKQLTKLCQIGGANEEYKDNYLLHTYDMYLVPYDFTNRNGYDDIGLNPIAISKDFTKPRPTHSILRVARRGNNNGLYMYNSDTTTSTKKIDNTLHFDTLNALQLIPGYNMVTKNIDYVRNDIIIYDFIKDIMTKFNQYGNKVSFIPLYYKGKFYIYIINYNNGELINYNAKFIKQGDLMKFNIIKSEYYTYLPDNLPDDETVYLLPVFIHIKTKKYKDYDRKTKTPYTNNNTPPNAYYDYDYYLPYDSVFNKLLLPYMNIPSNEYDNNFKYDSRSKNLEDIINTNTPLYLYAIDPTNLVDMRNKIKFVLFFLQNLKFTDNKGNNGITIANKKVDETIKNIYEHYFISYQLFFQRYKLLTDISKTQSISYPIGYTNALFNLFDGKIEQTVFENYYNVFTYNNGRLKTIEKINKYISTFKMIYLRVIEDIDAELVNKEKIAGINVLNIKSEKFTSIQGDVYNKVNYKVEYLKPYLQSILTIKEKIDEGVEQYITKIRKNIKSIEDYESSEFKGIKPSIIKDINANTAYGNYLRNSDNDVYIGLESTNNILETYNVKSSVVSADPTEVIFDLFQYMGTIKTADESIINSKEKKLFNFNPAPKFNDYIPFFSNKKNVEAFMNGLKATFQNDRNAKYPGHEIINSSITSAYSSYEVAIYRLYNLYNQKIINDDDKRALSPMRDIAKAYNEELKLKLEEQKKDKK